MDFLIVGAGFSGAVLARQLASSGYRCAVVDERRHVGGNCFSFRDPDTGILIHQYGPHIFHTDDVRVWQYVNQFSNFVPYVNRVKTTVSGNVYSLPINLHTINQFFGKSMSPDEAMAFVKSKAVTYDYLPRSFEEQGLSFVGEELYRAFFQGYTSKQWGVSPTQLPASILKRLPLRFNYDDNYFNHKFQGMPVEGYTPIFEKLLDHPLISLTLDTPFDQSMRSDFDHVFYSGPLDSWFDQSEGKLGYRTLDFEREVHSGDYQGTAVMNYGDYDVAYTRVTEHKHFAPWETHDKTVIFREFSRECEESDIPYYPIRLVDDKVLLQRYVDLARRESNVSFIGRLGTYRYLDMDVTIKEALEASEIVLECIASTEIEIPPFFVDVI